MENSDLESAYCRLLQKGAILASRVAISFSVLNPSDYCVDAELIEDFYSTLIEINDFWMDNTKLQINFLKDCFLSEPNLLELLFSLVYKCTIAYSSKMFIFKNSMVLITKLLLNLAHASQEARYKFLSSGLLHAQILALEIISSMKADETIQFLTSFHLQLLYCCFTSSPFYLSYAFSEKNWYKILQPLVSCSNATDRYMTKFVACHIYPALTENQQCLIELNSADVDLILECLNTAVSANETNIKFCGMQFPITVSELLELLCMFTVNLNNKSVIATHSMTIPVLATLLICAEVAIKKVACIFMLKLSTLETFTKALLLCDLPFTDILHDFQDQESDVLLDYVITNLCYVLQTINSQDIHVSQCQQLLGLLTIFEKNLEGKCDTNKDFSQVHTLCKMLEILELYIAKYGKEYYVQEIVSRLFVIATRLLNLIGSENEHLLLCLPHILYYLVKWTSPLSKFSSHVSGRHILGEVIYQIQTLALFEYTWLIKFFVKASLGIVLNKLNDEDFFDNSQDTNWVSLLKPWLKCESQEIRVISLLIGGCMACQFESEGSLLKLKQADEECFLSYLEKAIDSVGFYVSLCNNLFVVTVKTLIMSVKNRLKYLQIIFRPKAIFKAVVPVLKSHQISEIKLVCSLLNTVKKCRDLDRLTSSHEFPVIKVLEELQYAEDDNLKMLVVNALHTLQGHLSDVSGDLAIDQCNEHLHNSVTLISYILKCIDMKLIDLDSLNAEGGRLQLSLFEMWHFFKQCESEKKVRITNSDSLVSASHNMCTFAGKIIQHICTNRKMVDDCFLNCLTGLLALFTLWSDESCQIRYQILRTDLLLHLGDLICLLDSSEEKEIEVLNVMMMNASIIFSNCVQIKDFMLLYTPPGVVDWPIIVEKWTESNYIPLQFSAKIIYGYLAHNLDKEQLSPLIIKEQHLNEFLEMILLSAQSDCISVSGFGCHFTTLELINCLHNFLLLEINFNFVVQAPSIPISLLLILNSGGNAERKAVCRVLLILLRSSEFEKEMESLGMMQVLESVIVNSSDDCLKFLCQSIVVTLKHSQDLKLDGIRTMKDCLDHFLNDVCIQISLLLKSNEGKRINLLYHHASHHQLVEAIEEIHALWYASSFKIQTELIALIVNNENYLKTLHSFVIKAFKSLHKEHELVGSCFVKLSLCFLVWTQSNSQISQRLLKMGLFFDYIEIIGSPLHYSVTNFTTFVVAVYSNIVLHCVQQSDIQAYFCNIEWFNLLSQLSSSTNQELCLVSKLIAVHLTEIFSASEYVQLKFNTSEARTLVTLFNQCVDKRFAYKEASFFCKIPLPCLLSSFIKILMFSHGNDNTFLSVLESDKRVVSSLIQILKCENASLKTSACSLLWILLNNSNVIKLTSNDALSGVETTLCYLQNTEVDQDILCFINCCINVLRSDKHDDADVHKTGAKGYYLLKNMPKCIEICDKLLQSDNCPFSEYLILLKGKALHYSYIQVQRKFKNYRLTEDVRIKLFSDCYSLNKESIQLLGNAYDAGLLNDDEHTFFMLLRGMMDCIFQANQLDSCSRCYLCLNNLQNAASIPSHKTNMRPTVLSSNTQHITSNPKLVNPKQLLKKQKLIKSHIIPKAVLDHFVVKHSNDKRVIYMPDTSVKIANRRLIAPGEMVLYMLCHDCEELLSGHGETQFLPNFLKKIHTGAGKVETSELTIEYGPWLYQFCVGLVFRNMYLDVGDFINNEEVMRTIHNCRLYLLSLVTPMEADKEFKPPLIHIFISPSSVGIEEVNSSGMTAFLQDALSSHFGQKKHHSVIYPTFFVTKLGFINIHISIGNSSPSEQFSKFTINKTGGVYWVPPEKCRKENIPLEVWTVFQKSSKCIETVFKASNNIVTASNIKIDSATSDSESDGITSPLVANDVHNLLSLKVKNRIHQLFLPSQFYLNHTKRKVALPKGHVILLHTNSIIGPKEGTTFFVAVGNDKQYPISKPYLMWYIYKPNSVICGGAFFSVDTLELTKFLFDDKSKSPENIAYGSFATAKRRTPSVLKDLLNLKGFNNMVSLMCRVKLLLDKSQGLPSFDTKCDKERKCWYCDNLCQNCCLKPAVFGRNAKVCNKIVFFCSEVCQNLSPDNFKSLQIYSLCDLNIPPDIYVHCTPLSPSHTTLQHLYIRQLNNKKFPCEIEFAICVGDGTEGCPSLKPYVVFYSHHLFHQLFIEFFINDHLLAEEPLPHSVNESAWNSIVEINEANVIMKCLDKAQLTEITLFQLYEATNKTSTEINTVSAAVPKLAS